MLIVVLVLVAICSFALGMVTCALLAGTGRADAEHDCWRAEQERDAALREAEIMAAATSRRVIGGCRVSADERYGEAI